MTLGRWRNVLLLFYITLDFLDPSVPGVFFFDAENLFLDAVVGHANSQASKAVAEKTPQPNASAAAAVASQLTPSAISARPNVIALLFRPYQMYTYPSAFPPSSVEDH